MHSEFERLFLTGSGIAEPVCILSQVGPELALKHQLHLFGNVHARRFVPLVAGANAEPQRRRIADITPIVTDSNIDERAQIAGIDVNDKLGFDGAGSLSSLFQIQNIKSYRCVIVFPVDELE